MHIAIYVAIAGNGVIGSKGGLPWRLSTDLKRFKAGTMGKPIVMGRKTWESFPKRPLPGRLNIVVTRDNTYRAEGAETAPSLRDAIALAKVRIYHQALPLADRLHVTHVLASVDGDTVFPTIDPAVWRLASSEDVPPGEKDSHATRYAVYERRAAVH